MPPRRGKAFCTCGFIGRFAFVYADAAAVYEYEAPDFQVRFDPRGGGTVTGKNIAALGNGVVAAVRIHALNGAVIGDYCLGSVFVCACGGFACVKDQGVGASSCIYSVYRRG